MYENYQYFIKVVSTEVKDLKGNILSTNQYAVTEHQQDVTPLAGGMPTAMPGIEF